MWGRVRSGGCGGDAAPRLLGKRGHLRDQLVERFEDVLHKGARAAALGRRAAEAARVGLVVDIAPQPAGEGGGVEALVELGVNGGE